VSSDGVQVDSEHAVAFVTAAELRELDADPVLDRADYWRSGGRP